jgi:nitrile hydratase subunit beta
MDGIHDLDGMHGMGPINPEPNEPVFHEEWERRMFGVMMATFAGGHFNVDQFRHAIERMDPIEYLRTSYYEHWLHAVETLLVERGVIKPEDLEAKWAEVNRGAR